MRMNNFMKKTYIFVSNIKHAYLIVGENCYKELKNTEFTLFYISCYLIILQEQKYKHCSFLASGISVYGF